MVALVEALAALVVFETGLHHHIILGDFDLILEFWHFLPLVQLCEIVLESFKIGEVNVDFA